MSGSGVHLPGIETNPGTQQRIRRDSLVIYAALFLVGAAALVLAILLTRGARPQNSGVQADTPYDFAYRDPDTIIRDTNRIIVDADVFVKVTAHADRPDTVAIDTNTKAGANGTFTWTLIPQLGSGGPTQLAGEIYFQGTLYRICEAIIGSPSNFPPPVNRLYAEQYYAINNTGLRYRTPHQVDAAPFVDFMRTTIADTASFTGDGSLPTRRIRQMAGALIQNCTAA